MPTSSSLNCSPEPSVGWGAAFRTESYRFQWIANLLTSWAFEMETLILVWYVLIETDSPFFAAAIASLAYLGTLISPMIGVIAIASAASVYCKVCAWVTHCLLF